MPQGKNNVNQYLSKIIKIFHFLLKDSKNAVFSCQSRRIEIELTPEMKAEERQSQIESHLQQVEFASLDELSERVDASVSTVRRDLTALEARGTIRRTHGGARLTTPRNDEFAFAARDTHQYKEKEAIGKACAALIGPNQSVIVDAGTTAFHVARHLESKNPQIITNSLPVANLYHAASQVEIVLSGGVVYPRLGVLVGPLAVETFSRMHADIAVMSAGGITRDRVTNSHGLLIDIQRTMIQAVHQVFFCLDYSKFGRQSISFLCDLSPIHTIVTDDAAPAELCDELTRAGIRLVIAE